MPELDYDALGLAEFIALQEEISRQLRRRFQRAVALLFTDVVGSTAYFARFGDEEGRRLIQRHHNLLNAALDAHGGRLIDTAGDGAFCVAASTGDAAAALTGFQEAILTENAGLPPDRRLHVRCGFHWGTVLMDGDVVTGDAVNLAARVSGTAAGGELRLSEEAVQELPIGMRTRCSPVPEADLKGVDRRVGLYTYDWRDPTRFPASVWVVETEEHVALPMKVRVTFGRLARHQGRTANDIPLMHPDPRKAMTISRWHMELRWTPRGYMCRAMSRGTIEIDGRALPRGAEVLLQPFARVVLSGVLSLHFQPNLGSQTDGTRSMPEIPLAKLVELAELSAGGD